MSLDEKVEKTGNNRLYSCVWHKSESLTPTNPMYYACVKKCDGLNKDCTYFTTPYSVFMSSYLKSKTNQENKVMLG